MRKKESSLGRIFISGYFAIVFIARGYRHHPRRRNHHRSAFSVCQSLDSNGDYVAEKVASCGYVRVEITD